MPVELVLDDLSIESIPVHAEELGSLGLISTGLGKGALDEFSFKLIHGFAKVDTPFDHFGHKGFQLLFHNFFLRVDFLSTVPATSAPAHGSQPGISLSARTE